VPRRHPIHSAEDRVILNLVVIWLLLNALYVAWSIPPCPAEAFAY
jgi:hypothetical protein